MNQRGNLMTDRRAPDATTIHIQNSVDALNKRVNRLDEVPGQLAALNTNLQVLNNTLKLGALLFLALFPVICTWNYFLGKEVTDHGNILASQSTAIEQLQERIKERK